MSDDTSGSADAPQLAPTRCALRCRMKSHGRAGVQTPAVARTVARAPDRPLLPAWLHESQKKGKLLAEAPYGRRSAWQAHARAAKHEQRVEEKRTQSTSPHRHVALTGCRLGAMLPLGVQI